MAFGKRGAVSTHLTQRIAATGKSPNGLVPVKPTAYDTRRQAAILAKAASDEADARYANMAVVGVVGVVILGGVYSVVKAFLFA
jgi:hypothetical protein